MVGENSSHGQRTSQKSAWKSLCWLSRIEYCTLRLLNRHQLEASYIYCIFKSNEDLIPLSPNHFLHEIVVCSVPDTHAVSITSLNTRIKNMQKSKDLHKWFRKEYLEQLIHRTKCRQLAVGDIVLLEQENMK